MLRRSLLLLGSSRGVPRFAPRLCRSNLKSVWCFSRCSPLVRSAFSTEAAASSAKVGEGDRIKPGPEVDLLDEGHALFRMGKLNEAFDKVEEACELMNLRPEAPHPKFVFALNVKGAILLRQGKLDESMEISRLALSTSRRLLGKDHFTTALVLENNAAVALSQDKPDMAEEYCVEALQILKKIFSNKPHPSVAGCLANLGSIHAAQGRLGKAQAKLDEAVAIHEELGNAQKQPMAKVLMHLGNVLVQNNLPSDAQHVFERALSIYRKSPAGNAGVARSLTAIARILEKQDQHETALDKHVEALDYIKLVFGERDHEVSLKLDDMASCYSLLNKPESAMRCLREALSIVEEKKGEHSLEAGIVHSSMATVLFRKGDAKAVREWRLCLGCLEDEIPHHPAVLDAHKGLAALEEGENKFDSALAHYQRVVDSTREMFGGDHPAVANELANIASCLESQAKLEDALKVNQSMFEIYQNHLGDDHPSTILAESSVARLLRSLDQLPEALKHYQSVYTRGRQVFGEKHPLVHSSLGHVGTLYALDSNDAEALKAFEEVLTMQELTLGKAHLSLSTTVNEIASLHFRNERYIEAMKWFKRDEEITKQTVGEDHPLMAAVVHNVAATHLRMGEVSIAMQLLEECLTSTKKHFGEDHLTVASTLYELGLGYEKMFQMEKAADAFRGALQIREQRLSDTDPRTLMAQQALARVQEK